MTLRRRMLWRLLQRLAAAACGLLALLFVALAIVPRTGLYATFTVLSASMAPAIREGSVVLVVPVDPTALRVGDVISFTSQQPPYPTLTHRVVGVDRTTDGLVFQTRGDANKATDPWQVRYGGSGGKVVLAVPLAGYLMAASTSRGARAASGVVLILVLASVWLGLVWGRPRRSVSTPVQAIAPAAPARTSVSVIRTGIVAWLVVSLLTGGYARRLVR